MPFATIEFAILDMLGRIANKPLGLLNVARYYDLLLGFLQHSKAQGFMATAQTDLLKVGSEPIALLDLLGSLAPLATAPDDYRRI